MRVSERTARSLPATAIGCRVDLSAEEHRQAFVARLDRMSPEERLRAFRHEFDREQRTIWAGRYPEEVPIVNGEIEWIAIGLADLD